MQPDTNTLPAGPITKSPVEPITLLRKTKRWIKIVIGMTILALGIALIVLPGPAIIVIPLGLAILATELVWARQLLHKVKEKMPFKNKEEEEKITK